MNKPDPNSPDTWDWTPAVQAAADSIPFDDIAPSNKSLFLFFPPGQYRITSVVFPEKVNVTTGGAVFRPFDRQASLSHLMKFMGHNTCYDVTIDMEFAVDYASAIWIRGRYTQFFGCVIWKARYAWMTGDIAWSSDPSQGHLGDSENILHGCNTIWSITVIRAYGQNTILHLNDCLMYTLISAMGQVEPDHPDLPYWNSTPEYTIINCGALIYFNGGAVCNFSGVSPIFLSQIQPVSNPAYKNSFGRFYSKNTHMEIGVLFRCDSVGSYTADDNSTRCLELSGCHGYMASTGGNRIDLGSACKQSVWVSDDCNFYGNIGNNIIYSANASAGVHVGANSFSNYDVDYFQALHIARPVGYENFCPVNVTSSGQTINSTSSPVIMTSRDSSDLWISFEVDWYSTSSGSFTPKSNMRNVSFIISLLYPSGAQSDMTTYFLIVDGVEVDVCTVYGATPRATLRARSIRAGSIVTVNATCTPPRAASGSISSRLTVFGNV
ncbi:hypothetical protein ACK3BK_17015 [Pseudomonas sp. L7]|uniref:hypothetical protein n=1 Tax=Pseudomonas sp. L7 TaxID=3388343 RepID=UPI0039855EED